jgi:hypothetical protein
MQGDHMESLTRDLIIAVVGALVGALLVYLFSAGFQWTTKSRQAGRLQRSVDIADWQSGDQAKRQRVFGSYLFAVLKFFIIGSIIIGITTTVSDIEPNEPGTNNIDYINAVLDAIAVLFYAATLGKILQFTKLTRENP